MWRWQLRGHLKIITVAEVQATIKKMKSSKTAGPSGVVANMLIWQVVQEHWSCVGYGHTYITHLSDGRDTGGLM